MDLPDELDAHVKAHWRRVYGTLLAILRDPVAAEDVSQDVFVVALQRGIRPGPEMSAWFGEVARRLVLNYLRKKRAVPLPPEEIANLKASRRSNTGRKHPGFDEELAALRTCLEDLTPDERRFLASRYASEEPLALIAEQWETTEGYVKQRLYRLRRRLVLCVRRRLARGPNADA